MSLYGYKRKTKPANWTTVPGAVVSQSSARKWPRRRSKVAQAACKGYPEKAAAFVAAAVADGKACPVVGLVESLRNGKRYGWPISDQLSENHHWAGRGHGGRGPLLMDERLYIAMSKLGHRHVHANKAWAVEHGFLAPLGQWNVPVPPDAVVVRLPNGGIRVGK